MINDELEQKSLVAFGSLFEIKNGLNKEKEAFGHGNYIVNYMDVNKNTRLNSNDISGLVNTTDTECARFEVKENDLFFTRTSESSEEIGLTAAIESVLPKTVFSGFILRARPLTELSSSYYAYMLRTYTYRKEIIKHSSITTRALTSGSLLASMKIPSTSYNKQITITNYLSQIDNLIEHQSQKYQELQAIKICLLNTFFSNERLVNKPFIPLVDLCNDMKSGGTPKATEAKFYGGKIPFMSISDIKGDKLFSTKKFITEAGLNNSSSKIIDSNNIVYTMYATPGIAFTTLIDVAIPQSVISIELKDKLYNYYVKEFLNYSRTDILKFAMTGTQSNLTGEIVKNIKVPLMNISDVKKTSSILSQMDNLVDKRKVLSILVFINQELINDFFSYISNLLLITLK